MGSMSSIRNRVANSDWWASRSTTSVIPSGVLSLMVKAFLIAPGGGAYSYFHVCELCKLMRSPLVAANELFNTGSGSLPRPTCGFYLQYIAYRYTLQK